MTSTQVTERELSGETSALIQSCAESATILLSVTGLPPAQVVHTVDNCVYSMQNGRGPNLSSDELPEYLFGSLWGTQLVTALGWKWGELTFHEFEDSQAVGIFSSDRSLVIYPFHFIRDCLENDSPVTIELSFNMLIDGSRIPKLPPHGYENVMDNVHHIVPRD